MRKRIGRSLQLLFVILISFDMGCKHSTDALRAENWQLLGLEGKLVSRLVLAGDYLYACAGKDGLFRLSMTNQWAGWQYLGLADDNLERTLESGVTDLSIVNDFLLVSYVAGYQLQKHGIYRSPDNGQTWQPSDSGMIVIPEYPTTSPVIQIEPCPTNSLIIIAGTTTSLVYGSKDGGESWQRAHGTPGAGSINYAVRFNTITSNEAWIGGETGRFAPFLLRSTNSGDNWDLIHPLPPIGPDGTDNAVYDIAIDDRNPATVYLGMLGLIMKTTDNGVSWHKVLGWEDGVQRNWNLAINPDNSKELFATGARLYRTTNGGDTWDKLTPPNDRSALYALAVDWSKRILYVSTSSPGNGIYRLTF